MGHSPLGHKESDTTERLHFTLVFCSMNIPQVFLVDIGLFAFLTVLNSVTASIHVQVFL